MSHTHDVSRLLTSAGVCWRFFFFTAGGHAAGAEDGGGAYEPHALEGQQNPSLGLLSGLALWFFLFFLVFVILIGVACGPAVGLG
jgi:hypothetical protein